ncbi:exodeoxyribonuclease III [Clostridium sp. YIM B02515]|uniref:Exodeoxyribonuclease III n=1 Tax=Clostridium rhizosphaerae TaxID=2803861 RepID=A0ABS1T840_9CLOT|nr:exodeoxyribonuclease III [Clostridium rhizosphaerae]MBL4935292.1 exodeoxyribonuclease III [Clostridium rhizosphaerae]
MRIYSWNVNGLRAVMKKGFLEWIKADNPDILCIQETKLQEDKLEDSFTNIEGYYSYFSFAEKKGYSGVATYTKMKPLSVKHGIGIEKFDSEGRILETEFETFTLLNIYFPNGQMNEDRLSYKMEFYDALLEYCNSLVSEGKKLIICGDYNTAHTEMDIKNAKANEKNSGFLPVERAWLDKFIKIGYTDSFRYINPDKIQYSWWSYMFKARERNVGWRIDYHFVSNNLLPYVSDAKILNEVTGSDHCPVVIEIKDQL